MEKLLQELGSVCAVIGAQWGDEGKGKVVDILAEHYDVIARANGGANAGHTIIVGGKKHVFHLLPSGSLHEGKPVVLGAGMVIHLPTLLEEIAVLKDAGIDIVPRLHISASAHIVFEFHKELDGVLEDARADKIGTTKRGIGPAYMDKAGRLGIRMGRLHDSYTQKDLAERAADMLERFKITVDIKKEMQSLADAQAVIGSCVTDAVKFLHECGEQGKTILIEGAQATLLDIDHGTYPYVTSSSTTSAGALQGLGLPPQVLTSCIGVAKAYCTRVGNGAFPTEADEEAGNRLRERGGEYGATTGRPRRCGWLHIEELNRAARINGFTHWNITKLDVLDREKTIPVGMETYIDGNVRYEKMSGWETSTSGMKMFDQLPQQAQDYLAFIEKNTGIPCALIGTGPSREDMIIQNSKS